MAAHELRTPLTPLSMYLQNIERRLSRGLPVDPELSVREGHAVAEKVEDDIRAAFPGAWVVTHLEPATAEELAVQQGDPGIWKGYRDSDAA